MAVTLSTVGCAGDDGGGGYWLESSQVTAGTYSLQINGQGLIAGYGSDDESECGWQALVLSLLWRLAMSCRSVGPLVVRP